MEHARKLKCILNDTRGPNEIQSREVNEKVLARTMEDFMLRLAEPNTSVSGALDTFLDVAVVGYESNHLGKDRPITR